MIGIRLKIGDIYVWTGFGIHVWACDSVADAEAWIESNWPDRDKNWKDERLSAHPLPPFLAAHSGLKLKIANAPD